MEHRLFGTGPGPAHEYNPSGSGKWPAKGTVPDTLLGPEGSGVLLRPQAVITALDPFRGRTAELARQAPIPVGARPYVENYTVDASIFVNSSL